MKIVDSKWEEFKGFVKDKMKEDDGFYVYKEGNDIFAVDMDQHYLSYTVVSGVDKDFQYFIDRLGIEEFVEEVIDE